MDDGFNDAVFKIIVCPFSIARKVSVADTLRINFAFTASISKILLYVCFLFAYRDIVTTLSRGNGGKDTDVSCIIYGNYR